MKKISLLFLLCTFCISLFAQRVDYSIFTGVNNTRINGDEYKVYDEKSRLGFQIGGNVTYTTMKYFLFGSGLELKLSKGQFAVMSDYVSMTGQPSTLFPKVGAGDISINIPLYVGYKINLFDGLALIPNLGINMGLGIASVKDEVETYDANCSFVVDKWKCYDGYTKESRHIDAFNRFSFAPRLGMDVVISNHYTLGFTYQRDVTKVAEQFGCKKQSLNFKIGYLF